MVNAGTQFAAAAGMTRDTDTEQAAGGTFP
jgi:hypothetical protein